MFEQLIYINWTLVFTLVNTLILFFILKKFLYKPVKKMLESRKQEIEQSYELADKATNEANELKALYEQNLSQAKEEAADIMKTATMSAQAKASEIVSQAQSKASEMVQRADQQIQQEKKKAANEIKNDITEIALLAATKVVQKEISSQDHQKLIEEFIENVGEAKWQN